MAKFKDPHYDVVTFTTIARGAGIELMDESLRKVLANISDINTPAKDKRKVVLTIEMVPDETRASAIYKITCKETLASARGVTNNVYFGELKGEPVMSEFDPRQPPLDYDGSEEKDSN